MRITFSLVACTLFLSQCFILGADDWVIDSQKEWSAASHNHENITIEEGFATPTAKSATFRSKLKRFDKKQQAESIVFQQ